MIFDKKITGSGVIGSKVVTIVDNNEHEITVRVDGEIHKIKAAGKTAKELGEEIKRLC